MDDLGKLIIFTLIVITLLMLGMIAIDKIDNMILRNPLPKCQEDQVILGVGEFEAGRWEFYICGPAVDDYIGNY